jgi:hypothetical protein
LVSDRDGAHAGAHPTAAGALTRLAYAQARAARVDVGPILQTTHLTLPQIEDPGARLRVRVRDQINFLSRVATDLRMKLTALATEDVGTAPRSSSEKRAPAAGYGEHHR